MAAVLHSRHSSLNRIGNMEISCGNVASLAWVKISLFGPADLLKDSMVAVVFGAFPGVHGVHIGV